MGLAVDRVKETSTTTGTGNITLLGAVAQYQAFTVFAVNEVFMYAIIGQTGTEWEVGYGLRTDATTLVRTTPTAGSAATPVSFSAGTKDVFNTIIAARHDDLLTHGQIIAQAYSMGMP